MKSFKQFLLEQPTNNVGNGGYTNSANATGPIAGADPVLFKGDDDLLSQDYQTPAEPGLYKWQLGSGVYPVMHTRLSSNLGDGPSIDSMVAASKEFVDKMDESNQSRVRKTFGQFQEGWSNKYKKSIDCSNPKGFSQRAHCAGRKKK